MPIYIVRVTTAGSAGSATGTADSEPIYGSLSAIKVDYNASTPATTTVSIAEVGGLGRTVLSKAASATDATHYPVIQAQDTSGSNITGQYQPIRLTGERLRVTLALSNALTDAAVIYIQTV